MLDGKVAIITGAGGSLGEASAKLFARAGAAVIVNDLGGPRDGSGSDKSMAQTVVDAIKAEGGRASANGADISTLAGGQSVFDDAVERSNEDEATHQRVPLGSNASSRPSPTRFAHSTVTITNRPPAPAIHHAVE